MLCFGRDLVGVFLRFSSGFGFRSGFGRRLFNRFLVLAGGFLSGFRFGFGLFGGLFGHLEILRRFPGLGLGFFDGLFDGGLRFAGLHQFLLFLGEGLFGRFTGLGGFFHSFELRRLIRLRRLQRGLVKINLRFGENEGAFKIGGEFLRVTVALQLRNFFSVVQVPEFGDLIGARRSETLAVAAHGHCRNRSGVFYFANQLPGVHVPKPHRAVFAS